MRTPTGGVLLVQSLCFRRLWHLFPVLFRFTIVWEKIIVIIDQSWTEVFAIVRERVESGVA